MEGRQGLQLHRPVMGFEGRETPVFLRRIGLEISSGEPCMGPWRLRVYVSL